MTRAYDAIDADGHVLEPTTLWDDYMDPAFRDRAPRLVVNNDGKEMLLIEEKILGSQQGMGGIGGVGARQGTVQAFARNIRQACKRFRISPTAAGSGSPSAASRFPISSTISGSPSAAGSTSRQSAAGRASPH